jgi:hypothetical protein
VDCGSKLARNQVSFGTLVEESDAM